MKFAPKALAALAFAVLPLSVAAQSAGDGEKAAITVTAKDCQRLIQHTPANDVNYTPGVDVHGNPVVGAIYV